MFDEELDASLWYMLEADEKKRKEIIEFLKSLPEEFLVKIKDILICQNTEEAKAEREGLTCFEDSQSNEEGIIFSYAIVFTEQEKSLEIEKKLIPPQDNNKPFINFGATLTLVKDYPPTPPEIDEEVWVGTFTQAMEVSGPLDYNKVLKRKNFVPYFNFGDNCIESIGYNREVEIEYNLVETSNSTIIKKVNNMTGEEEIKHINLSQLPKELTIDYINSRYCSGEITRKLTLPQDN